MLSYIPNITFVYHSEGYWGLFWGTLGVIWGNFGIVFGIGWPSWVRLRMTPKKGPKNPQDHIPFLIEFLCFSKLCFHWFAEASRDCVFYNLWPQSLQNEDNFGTLLDRLCRTCIKYTKCGFAYTKHYFARFAKGWIGTSWASFVKLFSKRASGTIIFNLCAILGSNMDPKWALLVKFRLSFLGLHFEDFQRPPREVAPL